MMENKLTKFNTTTAYTQMVLAISDVPILNEMHLIQTNTEYFHLVPYRQNTRPIFVFQENA